MTLSKVSDTEPRLVVGAMTCYDGHYTIVVENVFTLGGIDSAVAKFNADRKGVWGVLDSIVSQLEIRRSARELITETPSQKSCTLQPPR